LETAVKNAAPGKAPPALQVGRAEPERGLPGQRLTLRLNTLSEKPGEVQVLMRKLLRRQEQEYK
jgi:hypothetical protein